MRTIPDFLRSIRLRLGLGGSGAQFEPGKLAFSALAADAALLGRLPRDQARRLCTQAELFATSLIRDARGPGGTAARDAAAQVSRSIRQYTARDDLYGESVDAMIASALSRAPAGLGGLLATLRRDARLPGDFATGLAMDAVLALGTAGLLDLRRDDAERLLLAAARHAALCLRGDIAPLAHPLQGMMAVDAALRIVEMVCERWRTLPLPSPDMQNRRDWSDLLVELWRDGATIAESATTEHRRRMWEDARDGHAFGAVWLAPSILSALVRADADRLARDARAACVFILGRRTSRPDRLNAIEAARTVLVACGEPRRVDANLVMLRRPEPVPPLGVEPLRRSMPPARASLA